MFLAVFHRSVDRVFRGKRGLDSEFGHTYGGAIDYRGLSAFVGQPPVHLLLRLNTTDPAVGITLPDSQWLPLLCAIRYGACDLGYRVTSDEQVTILHQTENKAWDDFPYDGFPEQLPSSPITLEDAGYNPADKEDAIFYAGVFGYDALSAEQFADLARHLESEGLPDDGHGWETGAEYLREGNCLPYTQGRPVEGCPELGCRNHGREASLRTFAIFQEGRAEAAKLWGPNCGSLQLIYQICPACSAIRTTNQAT